MVRKHRSIGFALIALIMGTASCRLQQAEGDKDESKLEVDRSIVDPKFPVRLSFGGSRTSYSDKQTSDTSRLNQSVSGVNLQGKRLMAEGTAIIKTEKTPKMYGYAGLDFHDDDTDQSWWQKQRSYALTFGLMPSLKIPVMPVIGAYRSWNQFITSVPEFPDVTKVDVIAFLVGVDYLQNIWITPQSFGLFYGAKLHLLNPGGKSTGNEIEFILGGKVIAGMFRVDVSLGYLTNTYSGQQPTPDESGMLTIKSNMKSTYGMVSFWL